MASKQKRFQLLHDTGRLCGYRAPTIRALIAGEQDRRAAGARRLRAPRRVRELPRRAPHERQTPESAASSSAPAALLPVPALAGHLGFLTRVDLRARTHGTSVGCQTPRSSAGGACANARSRPPPAAASRAKLAAGGSDRRRASPAARSARAAPHRRTATTAARRACARAATLTRLWPRRDGEPESLNAGARSAARARRRPCHPARQGHDAAHAREPGGFAFLGVPGDTAKPHARPGGQHEHPGASEPPAEPKHREQRGAPAAEHQQRRRTRSAHRIRWPPHTTVAAMTHHASSR